MKKRFVSLVVACCLIACLGLTGCNKDPKIQSGGTYRIFSYEPETVKVGDEEYEYSFGGVVTIGETSSFHRDSKSLKKENRKGNENNDKTVNGKD